VKITFDLFPITEFSRTILNTICSTSLDHQSLTAHLQTLPNELIDHILIHVIAALTDPTTPVFHMSPSTFDLVQLRTSFGSHSSTPDFSKFTFNFKLTITESSYEFITPTRSPFEILSSKLPTYSELLNASFGNYPPPNPVLNVLAHTLDTILNYIHA
jgi:hypothetical protein